MSEPVIRQPLSTDAILALLADGACIQRDRHGAAVIQFLGRCADEWEELRKGGWLNMTTSGTYVLSDKGRAAYSGVTRRD